MNYKELLELYINKLFDKCIDIQGGMDKYQVENLTKLAHKYAVYHLKCQNDCFNKVN